MVSWEGAFFHHHRDRSTFPSLCHCSHLINLASRTILSPASCITPFLSRHLQSRTWKPHNHYHHHHHPFSTWSFQTAPSSPSSQRLRSRPPHTPSPAVACSSSPPMASLPPMLVSAFNPKLKSGTPRACTSRSTSRTSNPVSARSPSRAES